MLSGQHPWDWRLCMAGPDRPRERIWSRRSDKLEHTGICGPQSEVLGFSINLSWPSNGCCYIPLVQLQLAVSRYWVSAVVLAAASQSPPVFLLDWLLEWLCGKFLDCVCLETGFTRKIFSFPLAIFQLHRIIKNTGAAALRVSTHTRWVEFFS